MKYLFLLLLFISVISCVQEKSHKNPTPTVSTDIIELDTVGFDAVKVVSYDSCEYIVVGSGQRRWGSHKGNCKNPIHEKK